MDKNYFDMVIDRRLISASRIYSEVFLRKIQHEDESCICRNTIVISDNISRSVQTIINSINETELGETTEYLVRKGYANIDYENRLFKNKSGSINVIDFKYFSKGLGRGYRCRTCIFDMSLENMKKIGKEFFEEVLPIISMYADGEKSSDSIIWIK